MKRVRSKIVSDKMLNDNMIMRSQLGCQGESSTRMGGLAGSSIYMFAQKNLVIFHLKIEKLM